MCSFVAVINESTAHIAKLVAGQRKTGKTTKIKLTPDISVRRPPERILVPNIVRIKVKELMNSYPDGIDASLFGAAFARRFGQVLNFQHLGFPSMKSFLNACTGIIHTKTTQSNALVVYPGSAASPEEIPSLKQSLLSRQPVMPKQGATAGHSHVRKKEYATGKSTVTKKPEPLLKEPEPLLSIPAPLMNNVASSLRQSANTRVKEGKRSPQESTGNEVLLAIISLLVFVLFESCAHFV